MGNGYYLPSMIRPADQTFEGGAFHPALETGRASGTLSFTTSAVHFKSGRGNVDLPLLGMKVALGGANDRLIFFTHPDQPQASFHTADHAVLNHPALANRSDLKAQLNQVRTRKRIAAAILLSIFCLLIGGIVSLVMFKDRLVKAAAGTLPVEWEIKLGDKLYDQVASGKRMVEDPEVQAQLKKITDPLLAGIKNSRYPMKFHIVEDPTLNAFAIPGGNVVIHSGLLLAADRPEEVAGVLAHEIAHVTQRHSFRGVISSLGLFIVLQAFIGDASSLLAVIANNGAFLVDRKFSRDFEREADDTGWSYLVQANVNPRGMIDFFQKMEAEERKMMEKLPTGGAETALSIISTHPGTQERMDVLEAKWKKLPVKTDYHKFELNYSEFKDTLRSRLHSAPNEKGN
jgi:beta-barrel assembly-enhancing protease